MGDHDDDFLDELARYLEDDGDEPPSPTWRATIRRGKLMLTDWAPFLVGPGPLGSLLQGRERAGITIADLTLHGGAADEVSVRYWVTGTGREEADQRLTDWAAAVGYKRIWLPDGLVGIEPDPSASKPRLSTAPRVGRAGATPPRSSGSPSTRAAFSRSGARCAAARCRSGPCRRSPAVLPGLALEARAGAPRVRCSPRRSRD